MASGKHPGMRENRSGWISRLTGRSRPGTKTATFRFYADLDFFLAPEHDRRAVPYAFTDHPTVKHAMESLGVPHPEVELILVNGRSVDFAYQIRDRDRISVYPHFGQVEVSELSQVLPPPLPSARFVLDNHLGRLAAYLRMLGFDSAYRNDFEDEALAEVSDRERRILLTRDRGLLMRSRVTYGYCLRSKDPRKQVAEVLRRYHLFDDINPFRHCMRCNGLLRPVPKEQVLHRLEPKTRRYYDEFRQCPSCGQVYWQGTHYRRMRGFIEALMAKSRG